MSDASTLNFGEDGVALRSDLFREGTYELSSEEVAAFDHMQKKARWLPFVFASRQQENTTAVTLAIKFPVNLSQTDDNNHGNNSNLNFSACRRSCVSLEVHFRSPRACLDALSKLEEAIDAARGKDDTPFRELEASPAACQLIQVALSLFGERQRPIQAEWVRCWN